MPGELTAVRLRDAHRWLVDVVDATDPMLCGGKTMGLARLQRAGFAVPAAICLTTAFYRYWLEASGMARDVAYAVLDSTTADPDGRQALLAELRLRVEDAMMPEDLETVLRAGLARLSEGWKGSLCVRSSAVYDDDADASLAGIHASFVVSADDAAAVIAAVKGCWASLWTDAGWVYRERRGLPPTQEAMAVVVQRFIDADRSGVASSADPLTNDRATVVIEAGWGAGAAIVGGKITADEYRVAVQNGAPVGLRRRPGRRDQMTAWPDGREATLSDTRRAGPVLSEAQALELARLVKAVEGAFRVPVDVEWVFDGLTFWVVQARPITALAVPRRPAPRQQTVWTRANLKEVFPELPSPLALSYLSLSLNRMFRSYNTSRGYALPPEARLVSVFHGRPYLNLTLMQQMTAVRGGDPCIAVKLFGGSETTRPPVVAAPTSKIGARLCLGREMLETFLSTPRRGRRLLRLMRRKATVLNSVKLERLDDRALLTHLEGFRATLLSETTIGRLHEIVSAQSRAYVALDWLLRAWIGPDAETLITRLMTGLGTLPNMRMTHHLMALAALAEGEARARSFLAGDLGEETIRGYREALAGTRFLAGLDEFLREFGHRGPYESDVMSARFAEDPAPVLRLVQLHLQAEAREDGARHAAERRRVQQAARKEVREALWQGRGWLAFVWRWLAFLIVRNALQRLLALRDEGRHVMTSMVAHLRQLVLEIGRRATRDGRLASPADMFFLSWYELPRLLTERHRDWRGVALYRRRQREHDATLDAPDLLEGDGTVARDDRGPDGPGGRDLAGFGVSPGTVTGIVKVVHSTEDVRRLSGEIVVCSTMEPTLTPIFPLVRGMVAEMGGLLSHAAILAREYGLPAVVNVRDATRRLRDGDRIELDGASGRIRVLERCTT